MSDTPKWTNGPWERDDLGRTISKYGRGIIAECPLPKDGGTFEAMANAALIAAAPELYEACAEFVRKVDAGQARSVKSYAQMQVALARARGESE